MGKALHVLIVEDSEDDVLLLLSELQRSGVISLHGSEGSISVTASQRIWRG